MAYFGTETNRLQKPAYKRTVKFQRDLYIYCKQPFMSQAGQIISPWKLLDVFSDVKWIWKNFKNSEYCHHSSTWKYTDTVRRNNMFAPKERFPKPRHWVSFKKSKLNFFGFCSSHIHF